jgi:hypothetical protein
MPIKTAPETNGPFRRYQAAGVDPKECFVEYNEDMPPVETPTLRVPRTDPHLSGAGERVREAAAELERLGIANPDGSRVRKDLPEDMRPNADRDFGG